MYPFGCFSQEIHTLTTLTQYCYLLFLFLFISNNIGLAWCMIYFILFQHLYFSYLYSHMIRFEISLLWLPNSFCTTFNLFTCLYCYCFGVSFIFSPYFSQNYCNIKLLVEMLHVELVDFLKIIIDLYPSHPFRSIKLECTGLCCFF